MTFLVIPWHIMEVFFFPFLDTKISDVSEVTSVYACWQKGRTSHTMCCSLSQSQPYCFITSPALYVRSASVPSEMAKFYVLDTIKLTLFALFLIHTNNNCSIMIKYHFHRL